MLYVVRNIRVRVRHKVANSISVWLADSELMAPHPPGSTFNWLPSCYYESTRTCEWSQLGGTQTGRTGFFLVYFAVLFWVFSFFLVSCTGLGGNQQPLAQSEMTRPRKADRVHVDVRAALSLPGAVQLKQTHTKHRCSDLVAAVFGSPFVQKPEKEAPDCILPNITVGSHLRRGPALPQGPTSQLWTFHPLSN